MVMYVCSVFPSIRTAPLAPGSLHFEFIKSLVKNEAGDILIEHDEKFQSVKYSRALPESFNNTACWLALRLFVFDPNVIVGIVYNTSTIPFVASYLRMYIKETNLFRELKIYGTLVTIDKWCDFLNYAVSGGRNGGPIVKESLLSLATSDRCYDIDSACDTTLDEKNEKNDLIGRISRTLEFTESQDGYTNRGIFLHPNLGRVNMDFDRMAIDFGNMGSRREDMFQHKKHPFGVLRVSIIDHVTLCAINNIFTQLRRTFSKQDIFSHLLYTQSQIMLVDDDIAIKIQNKDTRGNAGVIVIRTLAALQTLCFKTVHSAALIILSDAISIEEMRVFEENTVKMFCTSFHRCSTNPIDYYLPTWLSPENQKRLFIARFPRDSQWVVPLQLLFWERLIIISSRKWKRHPLSKLFMHRKKWLIVEDNLALTSLNMTIETVDTISRQLDIQDLCDSPIDSSVIIGKYTITLRRQYHAVTIAEQTYDKTTTEATIEDYARTTIQENGIGMYDFYDHVKFEKWCATLFGLSYISLDTLINRYVCSSTKKAFSRSQLRKLYFEKDKQECSVCYMEIPKIITPCGHLYCSECAKMMIANSSKKNSINCGACRSVCELSEWWVLIDESISEQDQQISQSVQEMSVITALRKYSLKRSLVLTPTRTMRKLLRDTVNRFLTDDSLSGHWYYPLDSMRVTSISDVTNDCLEGVDTIILVNTNNPCYNHVSMETVSWDEELSTIFAKWADQPTVSTTSKKQIIIFRDSSIAPTNDNHGYTLLQRLERFVSENSDACAKTAAKDLLQKHSYSLRKRRIESIGE